MEDKLSKILNILLYVIIGISVVLGIYFVFIKDFPAEPPAPDITMLHMFWAYALLIIAALLAIIFPIIFIIQNPAKAKSILITVIAFVVLFGIAYLMASGSTQGDVYEEFSVSAEASKRVGTGLIATYILGGAAIAVTIFSGISKIFK